MELLRLIIFFIVITFSVGCASPPVHTTREEAFNTSALENSLKRGVSTSSDIEAALGTPNGTGSLLLPNQKESRLVWFYEKVEIDPASIKRAAGYMEIEVRQDILLVFLKDDIYDGFFWFSGAREP